MARIVILGSAAVIPDTTHDNTHFVLIGEKDSPILVDCGSNPLGKIRDLVISDSGLQDVVLTHFHADHVSGVPNMLMAMWQLKRQAPLRIYGLPHCINRIEDLMTMFLWETWPNFFPVTFHRVRERAAAPVLENADFRITAWPVKHFIPTIGLRIENKLTGKVLAYTCDTQPTESLYELGRDADILLHEAAGEGIGHSSAYQAGETATKTKAKSLYLIHYEVWDKDPSPLVPEAQQSYSGPVIRCEDGDEYEF